MPSKPLLARWSRLRTEIAIIGVGIAAAAALLTQLMRRVSLRFAILDVPGPRSSHAAPTPRFGGVAICAAATAGWMAARPIDHERTLEYLTAGALIAAATGASDDVRSLAPIVKFAGELFAASVLLVVLPSFPFPIDPLLALVASAIWIVGYMNAFNFMDGSDGIAAGFAVISAAAIGVLAWQVDARMPAFVAFATACASAGFLPHNFPRASIFMGDAGSLFLGYTCAAVALLVVTRGADPVAAVLPLEPFLFDSIYTLLRRIRRHERIWQAHRTHLYQRLLARGWSHQRVAVLYYAWAVVCGALAIAYQSGGTALRLTLVGAAAFVSLAVVMLVRGVEVGGAPGAPQGCGIIAAPQK